MLPQEVELLPENDLIVFRRGMYATYGTKVRYYAEKKLAVRTKIPPPEMPTIRVDPAIANKSLRVISAAEADDPNNAAPAATEPGPDPAPQASAPAQTPVKVNKAAIAAAMAAPTSERVDKLFKHIIAVSEPNPAATPTYSD